MNSAKEKAKELVEKYGYFNKISVGYHKNTYSIQKAKDCALLCVDEIITSSPSLPILSDNGSFGSDIKESTEWWKEVREEIKNYESTN